MRLFILIVFVILLWVPSSAQRWTQLNPPQSLFGNTIFTAVADASSNVYAAGSGTDSAGEYAVAVLQNGSWKELGVGTGKLHAKSTIYSLTLDPSGNLYAGGMFTDVSGNYYVAKWNGSGWSETGPATSAQNFTGHIFALASDKSGNIYATGEMIDSLGFYYVSKFDGMSWQTLGAGLKSLHANGIMYAVQADAQGNVYAAGHFTNASGKYYVAKWDGSSWSELGTGSSALNANSWISQIQIDAAGNVYACGDFKDASGFQYVAKWNGSSWSELGTGVSSLSPNEAITAMCIDKNDHLFVGCQLANDLTGARSISAWTGSSWTKIDASPGFYFNDVMEVITSDPTGNLYAAGNFTDSWGERFVAKYSAGTWSQPGDIGGRMPQQSNPMKGMAVDTGGHIFAILGNDHASGTANVVRWNGAGWDELPEMDSDLYYNNVSNMAGDSLGNMYAIGNFHGMNTVARWGGTNWTTIPFSNGITASGLGRVATDKKGSVYVTGSFLQNGLLYNLVKWDGNGWTAYYVGNISNLVVDPNSNAIYATTGEFRNSGYNILKFAGDSIIDIGATPSQPSNLNANNWMSSLALDFQGNLYAAGSLVDSTGNPFVAKWDGTKWSHLEGDTSKFGAYGQIDAIGFDQKGNLFAGGNLLKQSGTYIGEWNGNSWQTAGDDQEFWPQLTLDYMARDGKGNIYAELGNQIYRYTGDQDHTVPPVCNQQFQLQMTVSKSSVNGPSASADLVTSGMPQDSSTSYKIEFSTDRDFLHLLPSNNSNKITVLAVDLQTGQNIIYGRMTTLDKCGNSGMTLDSVTITKSVDGGILDVDFPNAPILSYPNPVTNEIHVGGLNGGKSYTIEVFNNQGNKVAQLTVSGSTDAYLSAQSLEPGVYMVQVYDNTRGRRIGTLQILKSSQ
jgi:hypothetical protein